MRFRQSEITAFSRCRRKWHFAYDLGVVPVPLGPRRPASGHRDAGSAAHVGVETINKGGTLQEAMVAITEFVDTLRMIRQPEDHVLPPLTKQDDKEWWEIERLAHAMTYNYDQWQSDGNDIGIVFQGIEQEWEVEIPGTGIFVYGKFDASFYDPLLDGMVIRDNKSVAGFAQPPMDVDFQLRTYAWAFWQMTGIVPKRAEHLMMKRVLGTGNAKPPFFERYPIKITRTILLAHQEHLYQRCLAIGWERDKDTDAPALWPNPTKDCSWDCDYKEICPMVDDGSDYEAMIESHFVAKADED